MNAANLIALPGPGRAAAGPRCGLVLSSGAPCARPEDHAGRHLGVLTHGYGGYTKGCRCDTCRDAKADYMSGRRASASPAGGIVTDAQVRHGTRHAYEERGCRCDECTAFQRACSRHPYPPARPEGARP